MKQEDSKTVFIRDDQLQLLASYIVEGMNSSNTKDDEWISIEEVMKILGIRSRTTIAEMRWKGELKYSKLNRKTILYSRKSACEYISKNIRNRF